MKNIISTVCEQGTLKTTLDVNCHDRGIISVDIIRREDSNVVGQPVIDTRLNMIFNEQEFRQLFEPFVNTMKERLSNDNFC